jgi:hypothetical protein
MRKHWFLHGLKIVAFIAAFALVAAFVVMALWNALMPDLFGWRAIGFGQALGLLVLSRILLGGWRGGRGHGMHGHWRARMAERWERMTPEEREKFRAGMHRHCGRHGDAVESRPEPKPEH